MAEERIDEGRLNQEADKLAKKYGLDAEDAVLLREQALRQFKEGLYEYKPPFVKTTLLGLALEYSKNPSETLRIFKDEDLQILEKNRATLHDILCDTTGQFYTLPELADLVDAFIDFLRANRSHLIKTGYPKASFEESPWLDLFLSRLYFVKLPLVEPMQKKHNRRIKYNRWVEEPPEEKPKSGPGYYAEPIGYCWEDGKAYTGYGKPVTPCPYKKAAFIPGLPLGFAENAERLEHWRAKVFEIKIKVLQRIHKSLLLSDANGLLDDCIKIVAEALQPSKQDISLWNKEVEGFYSIFFSENRRAWAHVNCGIIQLIVFIGYFEKEITIGTWHRTRKSLLNLLQENRFYVYLQALGQPWRIQLDNALDEFGVLSSKEPEFWEEFRMRAATVFKNELPEKVILEFWPKGGIAPSFRRFWKSQLESARVYQEETGKLPAMIFADEDRIKFRPGLGIPQDTKGISYWHEDDFSIIILYGESYKLLPNQAWVYKFVYENRHRKNLTQSDVINKGLDAGYITRAIDRSHRLCDVFSGKYKKAWKELFIRKGRYIQVNLPPGHK